MSTKPKSSDKSNLPSAITKVGDVDSITIMVNTNSLRPAPWNPPIRTQLKELGDLVDSMRKYGFRQELPILVAADNSMIIDGHRRHTAASYLQIKQVPVTLMDGDPDELWGMINGTRMNVTGRQIMQAHARGMISRPPKYASLMARLESVVGAVGMKELGEKGVSPYVINQAGSIAKFCGHEGETDFLRATVFWLVNHPRMNTLTQAAIKENADAGEIERCIKRNVPLKRSYGA